MSTAIVSIPISKLVPGPGNLRPGNPWPEPDPELVASIRAVGVLEPVLTIPQDGHFAVVAGHRRIAGAIGAGLQEVPGIVRELSAADALIAALVENLQREDLTALEEARGIRQLLDVGNLKATQVAEKIGRSKGHVSKRLSLLELPAEVQALVGSEQLPVADAVELAEYAGQPEVLKAVLPAIADARRRGWRLDVKVEARRAQEAQRRAELRTAAAAKLREAKISVIKTDEYGRPGHNVHELGKGWSRIPMKVAEHSKLGCHAAYVDGEGTIRYVCTKPTDHEKDARKEVRDAIKQILPRGSSGKAGAAARQKAAESRERNKVLREVQPKRLEALSSAIRKLGKRQASDFALRQLLQLVLGRHPQLGRGAAALLIGSDAGAEDEEERDVNWSAYLRRDPDNLLRLAYAVGLVSGEQPFGILLERGYFDSELAPNANRYLDHLAELGYRPHKLERGAAQVDSWRPFFDRPAARRKGAAE